MPTDLTPTPTCAPRSPLRFSPASGRAFAAQVFTASLYRETHPLSDWFFNPWTGSRRPAAEVEADPQGLKLEPPSHDPGTTSPPTPATTEAGTATQEPGATDHEPASTSSPTPCAAPSAMNAVLSSLGAAVAEVNALTRTAVELSAKCRTLQAENERLRRALRWVEYQAKNYGPEALPVIAKAASRALSVTPPEPHMRAAAGEGDEA